MQTILGVIGFIVALAVLFIYNAAKNMRKIQTVPDNEDVVTLTDVNFEMQTKNKTILIDFWAAWCAPCRMMSPILNEVATELSGQVSVGKVNIEEYQSIAKKYKVRSIPTMIILKNGVETNRFVGIKTKNFLVQQLAKS